MVRADTRCEKRFSSETARALNTKHTPEIAMTFSYQTLLFIARANFGSCADSWARQGAAVKPANIRLFFIFGTS
jgi:hypothetical protein